VLTPDQIREALLNVIDEQKNGNLQTVSILRAVKERLELPRDVGQERLVLAEFHRLFTTGYLAWGQDLANANPPFCHVTSRGSSALEQLSRDPGNPQGYKEYLKRNSSLPPVAEAYISEALDCYVNGHYKAAAVMLGGASERLVLDVRDAIVQKIVREGEPHRSQLEDWRVKKVLGGLKSYVDEKKAKLDPELREKFEAYWAAFTQQIRAVRNDAGHPNSIDPVTYESVHAGFLVFPNVAEMANLLKTWAATGSK